MKYRGIFSGLSATVLFVGAASVSAALFEDYGTAWRIEWRETADGAAQDFTATEQASIKAMLDVWDNGIGNTPGRRVDLRLAWGALGPGVLGSASSPVLAMGGNAYTFTEYVWRQGNAGTRAAWFGSDTYGYDVSITFGTGITWNVEADNPTGSEIDLRSVALHEIGHPVGFMSTFNNGADTFWGSGLLKWDTFLRDSGGNAPQAGTVGTPGNFNQIDNPVFFVGPNAKAANGGNDVWIYAPDPYSGGSSLSHVNTGTYPTDVMQHAIGAGVMRRDVSTLDWAIMQDLGWSLTPVPEPSAALLLLVGLSFCLSRRRAPRSA